MKRYGWVMGITRWRDETGTSHLLVVPSSDGRGPARLACGSKTYHGGVEAVARGSRCEKCERALPFYEPVQWRAP